MTIKAIKPTSVGSKKAADPEIVNNEIPSSTKRQGNFDQVAGGICPHDGEKLGDEVKGKGIGVTRVCAKCSHKWYLNQRIRTCKCQTCSTGKRSTGKPEVTESTESASRESDASILSGLHSNWLSR